MANASASKSRRQSKGTEDPVAESSGPDLPWTMPVRQRRRISMRPPATGAPNSIAGPAVTASDGATHAGPESRSTRGEPTIGVRGLLNLKKHPPTLSATAGRPSTRSSRRASRETPLDVLENPRIRRPSICRNGMPQSKSPRMADGRRSRRLRYHEKGPQRCGERGAQRPRDHPQAREPLRHRAFVIRRIGDRAARHWMAGRTGPRGA